MYEIAKREQCFEWLGEQLVVVLFHSQENICFGPSNNVELHY